MYRRSNEQFSKLSTHVGGSISDLDGDRILQFHNSNGNGQATSVILEAGFSFMDYDLELENGYHLHFPVEESPVLFFIYCTDGTLSYSWGDNREEKEEIIEFQTVILGSQSTDLTLEIPKKRKSSFAVIRVEKEASLDKGYIEQSVINAKLFNHFLSTNALDRFHYHGTLNLTIKEQLSKLRELKERGVVRHLLIKGIVNFTLALEIMHHEFDIASRTVLASNLTKNELVRVKQAVDQIAKHPGFNYSIESLCDKYHLPARKLQEGFKVLTGNTVGAHISNERLNLAEKLLKQGNLNISEIVYSIGFSSRSYFSKIFKDKFNCTPTYYLKQNGQFKMS